ncbi:MAG TPA: hypothetical protein VN516_09460 [Candidatus Baltobacteraceae bacterium]|nr:hypothetical protein [Candidatus Baltobacteraceae bacterium]
MKAFTQTLVITIAPGATERRPIAGRFLKIRSCNLPFPVVVVSFDDASSESPISSGDTFSADENEKFGQILFRNTSVTDTAIVSLQVGTIGITFNPADNRPASTYFKGNLGYTVASDVPVPPAIVVSSLTMTSNGQNYAPGDVLTIVGGTGSPAKIQVLTIRGQFNRIDTFKLIDAGNYTVAPASPNTPTGGSGTGAQFTLVTTGGAYLTLSNGLLTLTSGNQVFVDSTDNLRSRRQIVFYVNSGTLAILDMAGRTMFRVSSSAPLTMETNAQLVVMAVGGGCTFSIGETYFSQP